MGRVIASIVVGYLVMAIMVFVLFKGAYFVMGASTAFKPGSYDASTTWIVVSFVLGLIAAIVSGLVCAAIAPGTKAPLGLAGVTIVLGLVLAIPVLMATPTTMERTGDVSNMEAMKKAHQPAWVALLNPFVGAGGILIGAGLRKKR